MSKLTKKLESVLGPDTADLAIRVGLHSGPVTVSRTLLVISFHRQPFLLVKSSLISLLSSIEFQAGVLRGENARFQ